ncbi:tetratricopeptide repeat protein [Bacillus sp. REN16]|uniref:tetratricopeptide repeat protein n=1 Tax=Bacillus sp. REN16 TaxID=2887296 RepID=UPI001E3BF233|nr:tetratricopeptide repeat protein [Bacillus sp. REN16]MCC3356901.1 tetratricopeptide repeat protein [Bacillus sp. REN16]
MTSEHEFITKTYYQTIIPDNDKRHPIEILGEAFISEAEKEPYDLSYIRFAQGELYFNNKDYESAIYKWESISNDLEPWAKKNIADAYYELGLLSNAEEVYGSIISKNKILTSEVSLCLFSLYLEDQKLDAAYRVLQEAIEGNPDYPELTSIAKRFYEEQDDWKNAIELAINEAKRTQDLIWFDALLSYFEAGHGSTFSPDTFVSVLLNLYELDQPRFKLLLAAIWKSYQQTDDYLGWLHSVIQIMKDLEINPYESWSTIIDLFGEAYLELTTGSYLLRDIGQLMPKLLINWLNTTTATNGLTAAAAILAWDDIFPSAIKTVIVKEAEILLENAHSQALSIDECHHFVKTIIDWAAKNNIETSHRLVWGFDQLFDENTTNLLVLGKGKGSFVNSILEEEVLTPSLSTFASIQYGEKKEIIEVSDTGRCTLATFEEVTDPESIIEVSHPSAQLQQSGLRLNLTGYNEYFMEKRKTFGYLPVVDGVLFVHHAETLTELDLDYLAQIKHSVKDIPVHFVLPNTFEREKVKEYFPDSVIHSVRNGDVLRDIKSSFLRVNRVGKILFLLRKTISNLLKKRADAENKLIELIAHNEEFITRLTGFNNSLHDKEMDQSKEIADSFEGLISEVKHDISEKIPKILAGCSEYITEESNLNQLHIELNEKMNEEIRSLFDQEIVPSLSEKLQEWIESSNQKLVATQAYLDDMTQSLAEGYPEKELQLHCDFKVVEDWRRDISRMTYQIQIDKENIMLRHNPGQVLLKGAGKVLGLLPQKQQAYMLNQYKRYVDNASYTEVVDSIQRKFWQQFDFFKKSLQQDVGIFYKESLDDLSEAIDGTQSRVEQDKETLAKMKSNPEVYYDPLKLFETRLVQYERIWKKGRDIGTGSLSHSRP